MPQYTVSDYQDMFRVCTDSEIRQFAEQALAVSSVLRSRTHATHPKFVPFKTQAALNTNTRVLSALARTLRGRNMPVRKHVVAALSSNISLFTNNFYSRE